MEASGNGTIYDDLTALYNDFEHMSQYAGGQQTSGYSSSAEQANVDAQQLNKDCNSA